VGGIYRGWGRSLRGAKRSALGGIYRGWGRSLRGARRSAVGATRRPPHRCLAPPHGRGSGPAQLGERQGAEEQVTAPVAQMPFPDPGLTKPWSENTLDPTFSVTPEGPAGLRASASLPGHSAASQGQPLEGHEGLRLEVQEHYANLLLGFASAHSPGLGLAASVSTGSGRSAPGATSGHQAATTRHPAPALVDQSSAAWEQADALGGWAARGALAAEEAEAAREAWGRGAEQSEQGRQGATGSPSSLSPSASHGAGPMASNAWARQPRLLVQGLTWRNRQLLLWAACCTLFQQVSV